MGNAVPAEPLLFLKPSTALNGPQEAIRCPEQSSEVHHEAELAVVIGRPLARATAAEARSRSSGTPASTTSPRATSSARRSSSPAPRGSTPSARVGPVVETGLDPLDLAWCAG